MGCHTRQAAGTICLHAAVDSSCTLLADAQQGMRNQMNPINHPYGFLGSFQLIPYLSHQQVLWHCGAPCWGVNPATRQLAHGLRCVLPLLVLHRAFVAGRKISLNSENSRRQLHLVLSMEIMLDAMIPSWSPTASNDKHEHLHAFNSMLNTQTIEALPFSCPRCGAHPSFPKPMGCWGVGPWQNILLEP